MKSRTHDPFPFCQLPCTPKPMPQTTHTFSYFCLKEKINKKKIIRIIVFEKPIISHLRKPPSRLTLSCSHISDTFFYSIISFNLYIFDKRESLENLKVATTIISQYIEDTYIILHYVQSAYFLPSIFQFFIRVNTPSR